MKSSPEALLDKFSKNIRIANSLEYISEHNVLFKAAVSNMHLWQHIAYFMNSK